ncbi:MAG: hypothetical protein KC925_02785 [Candidatus Doudnabacteria bacterium]|nr:hypothetical protein [Candidatus Doudnabacteria bacterium]
MSHEQLVGIVRRHLEQIPLGARDAEDTTIRTRTIGSDGPEKTELKFRLAGSRRRGGIVYTRIEVDVAECTVTVSLTMPFLARSAMYTFLRALYADVTARGARVCWDGVYGPVVERDPSVLFGSRPELGAELDAAMWRMINARRPKLWQTDGRTHLTQMLDVFLKARYSDDQQPHPDVVSWLRRAQVYVPRS